MTVSHGSIVWGLAWLSLFFYVSACKVFQLKRKRVCEKLITHSKELEGKYSIFAPHGNLLYDFLPLANIYQSRFLNFSSSPSPIPFPPAFWWSQASIYQGGIYNRWQFVHPATASVDSWSMVVCMRSILVYKTLPSKVISFEQPDLHLSQIL